MPDGDSRIVKMSVNLPQPEIDALREVAARNSTTVTQALREALAVQRFFHRERERGCKVLIEQDDGRLAEVLPHG